MRLVPLEMLREDQAASQVPQSVLEKPLLHLYIFTCEVNRTALISSVLARTQQLEGQ